MVAFFRVLKFALQDMWRNASLSLMTVLILVLMLLSVNTLLIIRVLTTAGTESVKNQIDVSVYFSQDAKDEHVSEIQKYVGSFPEVTNLTLLSREQVLEHFRARYKDNKKIIDSLDEFGQNPFGPTLIIKTREPSDYGRIITALDIPEYESLIEKRTFEDTQHAIEKINNIIVQVEHFTLILTALFAIIAFLIIFNTIRVAIYTQRTEISIKKLVGATNWFVRGPYIIESMLFSVASIAITASLVSAASRFLDGYIAVIIEHPSFLTSYFLSHIVPLAGTQFLAVLALTMFSSALAMRKYLKV